MLAKTLAAALVGTDALPVEVEVDCAGNVPGFRLVGLPDAAIRESYDRVKAAIYNSGLNFPRAKIVVSLAPGDLKKEGPTYDLAIAVGMLTADGQLPAEAADEWMLLGELALDGRLRRVKGALPAALCARKAGKRGVILPAENANEAAVVSGIEILGAGGLLDVVAHLDHSRPLSPTRIDLERVFAVESQYAADFADVRGQEHVKRALTVAAAGGHNLLMIGPPGAGKSMLAQRLPTILPPLTLEEAIETTKVHSVAGLVEASQALVARRPFRAPHHTVSYAGLVGGGTFPTPGEISLAHNGVLFLDELPEFDRKSREALRQPLEARKVTISRTAATLTFPADIMLVVAMNPSPSGSGENAAAYQMERYLARISGPLLDRIDIQIEVPAVSYRELVAERAGTTSHQIREAVVSARERQASRFKNSPTRTNAGMTEAEFRQYCRPAPEAEALLRQAVEELGFSARAYTRVLKVARTIADLAHEDAIAPPHVMEAIQYRSLDRKYWC